ncbi:AlpA family transcriptional regulator [Pseudoclavibacter sp. RFBA6]|uniref:helix-turn-helix transcriptional regulator n=1 Tax=Pseudoclavibacter sp. RFBA6 TaxID=2080573 RepID=UPI000CE81C05|nr:helix-turn-helix domain-containing protein [Pseudoclavibacter sp. RFBA6]PPG38027.1 hypothetical protein C5C17_15340 [Pseudoclavibacter sp. RFBA6]
MTQSCDCNCQPVQRYLTVSQVAERIGYTPKTLYNWRGLHKGPPAVLLDGSLRYESIRLEAWIKNNVVPA